MIASGSTSAALPALALGLALACFGCSGDAAGHEAPEAEAADSSTAPPGREAPSEAERMPAPRAGSEVLGTPIAELLPTRWIGDAVPLTGPEAPRATLVRFWTDTCPFCARSLPEIEMLRTRFGPQGFEAVGVYHPKPPREVSEDDVARAAERLTFSGPVAIDADWTSLRAIWLDATRSQERRATSASFLIDDKGIVRFVHPGPEFVDDDLAQLERAIRVLLNES